MLTSAARMPCRQSVRHRAFANAHTPHAHTRFPHIRAGFTCILYINTEHFFAERSLTAH